MTSWNPSLISVLNVQGNIKTRADTFWPPLCSWINSLNEIDLPLVSVFWLEAMGHNTLYLPWRKWQEKHWYWKAAFKFLHLDGGNLKKTKLAETHCKGCGAKVTKVTCFVHFLHRKWSQGNWLLTLFYFQQQFWVSLIPACVLYSVEILPRWNGSDFSIGLACFWDYCCSKMNAPGNFYHCCL